MISPWVDNRYPYSFLQLNAGYNPKSKLEVVSLLNLLSHTHDMYIHDSASAEKYNPKIYIGSTIQTTAARWNFDEKYPSTSAPNHDEGATQKQQDLQKLQYKNYF